MKVKARTVWTKVKRSAKVGAAGGPHHQSSGAMFFVKKLKRDILLQPMHLGPKMKHRVELQLREEVEGKCLGKHGFVIQVLAIEKEDIVPGKVDNDFGSVHMTVTYQAIMLRPFKNEVLDTIVFNAADDNGFFSRVGPLEIYTHKYNMPQDMKFDNEKGDAWVSEDGEVEIKEGSIVRLRVIGVSIDAGQMVSFLVYPSSQEKCADAAPLLTLPFHPALSYRMRWDRLKTLFLDNSLMPSRNCVFCIFQCKT